MSQHWIATTDSRTLRDVIDDEQQRALTATYTAAQEQQEAANTAWRIHHRTVALVYEAGQQRPEDVPVSEWTRTTEEDIGAALGVSRQQVWAWRQSARERAAR